MEPTDISCKQCEECLDAFHDHELGSDERAKVEAHLKKCERCGQKLVDIDRLVNALQSVPRLQLQPEFSAKLDLIVQNNPKVVAFRPRVWVPMAVAAAVVALAIGFKSGFPGAQSPFPGLPSATVTAMAPATRIKQPAFEIADNSVGPATFSASPTTGVNGSTIADTAGLADSAAVGTKAGSPATTAVGASSPVNNTNDIQRSVAQIPVREANVSSGLASVPSTVASGSHGGTHLASVRPTSAAGTGHYNVASSNTQEPAPGKQGAMQTRPPSTANQSPSVRAGSEDEIAELPGGGSNSFNDAVGISTDEDGLYDIKM